VDKTVQYVWSEYRNWALTSRNVKARLEKAGGVVLLLSILGTAAGTLSPVLPDLIVNDFHVVSILPWASAALLAVAAYLTSQLLADSQRQVWVKARAVAEGLKSECFKYLAGAPPYDVEHPAHVLADKAYDLQRSIAEVKEQVKPEERLKGLPTGPLTLSAYVENRVRDQIDKYYIPGISRHSAALRRAKLVALGSGFLIVLLSVGSSKAAWAAAVLGIITTAAAAIAAWFQSGRHQQLALNYQDAVSKLELLVARSEMASDTDKRLVVEAEAVFQAEHAAWLSEWQTPATGDAPEKTKTGNPAVADASNGSAGPGPDDVPLNPGPGGGVQVVSVASLGMSGSTRGSSAPATAPDATS